MATLREALKVAQAALAAEGVKLDLDALVDGLKVRTEVAQRYERLQLQDLALAWACARGDSKAIAHFEDVYFTQAVRALKRMRLSQTLTDDVLGWMRFELFARPNGPLISTYSGRGDLGSWVRSIAVHEGLKRAKRERREVTSEEAADLPIPEAELAAMRGAYGAELTRALKEAFAALTTEQRNLLRQSFLDGLSIDALAGVLKVHRATVARRITAAREELVKGVKERLRKDLDLSARGVDGVITLSNLKESLSKILRKTGG